MGLWCDDIIKIMGKPTIPDDKKDELSERIFKLFYEGGMCSYEEVKLFQTSIQLIVPHSRRENGDANVYHNYFDERLWDRAGFHAKDGTVWSDHIGWGAFRLIVTAAYILEEQYSTTPFHVEEEDRRLNLKAYGGWLNNLFGEQFTLENRNYWDVYLARRASIAESTEEGKAKSEEDEAKRKEKATAGIVNHVLEMEELDGLFAVDAADRQDYFQDLVSKERPENENLQPGYDLYHRLRRIKEMEQAPDDQLQTILRLMCDEEPLESDAWLAGTVRDELVSLIRNCLPQAVIRFLAQLYDCDFWELWAQVDGRETICLPYKPEPKPLAPVPTDKFLMHETRLYLYYWREDNGISLEGLEDWFADLRERFDRKMACETHKGGKDMIQSMVVTMDKADKHYGDIYAFKDMFYEFLSHSTERKYQAWWEVFCDLVDENWDIRKADEEKLKQGKSYFHYAIKEEDIFCPEKPARMEVKGYLALMANPVLRTKVFESQ